MQKSINLIIDETKKNIVGSINKSGLPITVTKMIVESLYNEMVMLEKQTLQQESQEYQQALEAEKESGDKVEETK